MTTTDAGTGFDVDAYVAQLLAEYGGPEVSAAELLCDRHDPDAVAFTFIGADLAAHDLTYGELRTRSEQGAAALAALGVEAGDTVATLMGKSPDLVVALLSIWRLGAVQVPLFTAFAWPAIQMRIDGSAAEVVIADPDQREKIEKSPGTVIVVGEAEGDDLSWPELLADQDPGRPAAVTGPDAALVMIFTSGTTGTPKGVPVPVFALAAFQEYIELGLDVRETDVFWNAADPGWAYGLYYAILGPMAAGRRSLLLTTGFSPELSAQVLRRFAVTNFAAAPTVYRAMRAAGPELFEPPIGLRRASSAGEPLTPEVVEWATAALGVPVRDHYGQTEHGMMIINGWHDAIRREVRAGAMGHALPGWSAAVLDDQNVLADVGALGQVAIDTSASPLMWFRGYHLAPDKTAEQFSADGRWYLTGDAGAVDADGYFSFSARDDDVIITSGYRVGPFEIESVMVTHPQVGECAVVGVPDELRGEVIEAFVVARDPAATGPDLVTELQDWVKKEFAKHAYPRRIHFVDTLPKTPSGKIQRFLLRKDRAAQG